MKVLKDLGRFLLFFAATFAVIYLVVFFGGWRLFEEQDPILVEVGVSAVVAVIFYAMYVLDRDAKDKLARLESRIAELEALHKKQK